MGCSPSRERDDSGDPPSNDSHDQLPPVTTQQTNPLMGHPSIRNSSPSADLLRQSPISPVNTAPATRDDSRQFESRSPSGCVASEVQQLHLSANFVTVALPMEDTRVDRDEEPSSQKKTHRLFWCADGHCIPVTIVTSATRGANLTEPIVLPSVPLTTVPTTAGTNPSTTIPLNPTTPRRPSKTGVTFLFPAGDITESR